MESIMSVIGALTNGNMMYLFVYHLKVTISCLCSVNPTSSIFKMLFSLLTLLYKIIFSDWLIQCVFFIFMK